MKDSILHSFENQQTIEEKRNLLKKNFIIAGIAGITLGIITGTGVYFLKNNRVKTNLPFSSNKTSKKTAGVKNEKLFPDAAEGILKEGGIDGEGSFHLERPGGESQYVYLTSSTIDLSQFIGKKVKVWGKTYKAEKAGWLMDVGYLEVVK